MLIIFIMLYIASFVVVQSLSSVQFSSVQSLSHVWLFATPWIAAHQASLSITNSWSSFRLASIKSVMPSSHLILCHPLLLLPPIPPSIWSHHFMGNRWGNSVRLFLGGAPKSLQMVTAAMKLKEAYSFEEKLWPTYIVYSKAETLLYQLRSV